jgi:hypothetical protein
MQKDRLSEAYNGGIMPAMRTEKTNRNTVAYTYLNFMRRGGTMTTRKDRGRRPARPITEVLARPRELFGESLPELLLLTAVVAAVVSAVLALNGVG